MSIEKRIKRRVTGRGQKFFASVLPGFEGAALKELNLLGITDIISEERGGIEFAAKINGCCAVNLMSRTVTRVMMRLFEFRARDFFSVYEKTGKFDWHLYLTENSSVEVRVSTAASKLYHTDRIKIEAQKGLFRAFDGKIIFNSDDPARQIIFLRIADDVCTVSLDTSGDFLYRRGYKPASVAASIRETTAASILIEADIFSRSAVYDPMCGSGTFSVEAAGLISCTPAASERKFPFESWPGFSAAAFAHMKKKLYSAVDTDFTQKITIAGADINPHTASAAEKNISAAGFNGKINISVQDFFSAAPPAAGNNPLLVINPPYGERLKLADKIQFYRKIGETIRSVYRGWSYAVIVPAGGFERAAALDYKKKINFSNGGIRAAVLFG